MAIRKFATHRLVKSEDLNHHGTLFAGRTAEWFVESGFIAASNLLNPESIICLKIHGMQFSKPVKPGETVAFQSKIVYAGKSSIVAYISVSPKHHTNPAIVEGFITFVHVDKSTTPQPHGIKIIAETEEDKKLQALAIDLKNK